MCHCCCLVHLVNFARCKSLFAMELEKLLVNGKIYRFLLNKCPISIISNVANNKTELKKTVRLTSFQKLLIVVRFNLLQVCSSVPPFVLAVLIIPSFHVVRSYFCFTQFGDSSLICCCNLEPFQCCRLAHVHVHFTFLFTFNWLYFFFFFLSVSWVFR